MSEQPIGLPIRGGDSGIEYQEGGTTFSGEFAEREHGDPGFEGENDEREHEGLDNVSRETEAPSSLD
ncbi:MAG TPA: hypothetical protein V6D47_03605 [Oscillatoriaceae cyanobacterium]